MPEIKIEIINCDGKAIIIYKDTDIELINEIVQAIAKRNGASITPLKRKGGD